MNSFLLHPVGMEKIRNLKMIKFNSIFCILLTSTFLCGCQNHKHQHNHQHQAPNESKQSINQSIHLPFHIEQKYEHHVRESKDIILNTEISPKPVAGVKNDKK